MWYSSISHSNKLIENPGVWTVLSYKFGRLMVKDSNELEWLYIIKSGEARVIKQLTVDKVNMDERHEQIQEKMDDEDPFHHTQILIDFLMADNSAQSSYKLGQYRPPVRSVKSAPPARRLPRLKSPQLTRASSRLSALVRENSGLSSTASKNLRAKSARVDPMLERIQSERENTKAKHGSKALTSPTMWSENKMGILGKKSDEPETSEDQSLNNRRGSRVVTNARSEPRVRILDHKDARKQSRGEVIQTGLNGEDGAPDNGKMVDVPPFVQLETLHSGMVFGMRACLEEHERGPAVSLVSAGCEVLQINKKFFLMNADDALISLIKLKHKPYPSEEDLLDRLDISFQWNEFKHKTLNSFVRKMKKRKGERH